MPFHRPIPESKTARQRPTTTACPSKPRAGLPEDILGAWVQAEKMMQIALMLPWAAFIGWLIGYGLDRWLHQTWIAMIGIVVGILSGLVGAIRMAMVYAADPKAGGKNGDGDRKRKFRQPIMSGEINPFGDMTDADLEALLRRAIRITVIVGLLAALALWIASGWRNAAMMASGAAISTASIYEWRRLVRFIIAKMDKKQTPRGDAGRGGLLSVPPDCLCGGDLW